MKNHLTSQWQLQCDWMSLMDLSSWTWWVCIVLYGVMSPPGGEHKIQHMMFKLVMNFADVQKFSAVSYCHELCMQDNMNKLTRRPRWAPCSSSLTAVTFYWDLCCRMSGYISQTMESSQFKYTVDNINNALMCWQCKWLRSFLKLLLMFEKSAC